LERLKILNISFPNYASPYYQHIIKISIDRKKFKILQKLRGKSDKEQLLANIQIDKIQLRAAVDFTFL
jgi:hypothetical protein